MFRFFIGLLAACLMLSACKNQPEKLDHGDPVAVARAMITAARDRDLRSLVYTYHQDHEYGARQALLGAFDNDGNRMNDFDPEEWGLFTPGKKLAQDVKSWKGYLNGPKYDEDNGRLVALWAFSRPDQYNEMSIVVLNRHDEGWFVYDTWFLKQDEFEALTNRPDEVIAN